MPREHADLAVGAGDDQHLDVALERRPLGRDQRHVEGLPGQLVYGRGFRLGLRLFFGLGLRAVVLAPELPRLLHRLLDRADHVERLLGQVIVLAREDLLEALDRVLEADVLARLAGELLGHEVRLREEALDLAGAADDQLVLVRELVDAEDRDDVLQFLVALQDLLHAARGRVVLLRDDPRLERARGRVERVDRRIDALLDDRPREHGRRVQVREGVRRRGSVRSSAGT